VICLVLIPNSLNRNSRFITSLAVCLTVFDLIAFVRCYNSSMSDDQPNKRQKVVDSVATDHSYKDYSNVPIQQGVIVDSSITLPDLHMSAALFPAKLHEIVSNPEYEHIISWRPHGRSWEVKDSYSSALF
jgi:hypothetical protein